MTTGRKARHPLAVGVTYLLAVVIVAGCSGHPAHSSVAGQTPSPGSSTTPVTSTLLPTATLTHPRATDSSATPPDRTHQPQDVAATALAVATVITVKGRAPRTGYDRDLFGSAWSDDNGGSFGHNGCDTRNDILRRDLQHPLIESGTNGCVVMAGLLNDPYTGQPIRFHRGTTTSTLVQIDHVVALSDAWQKGAWRWTAAKRQNFANDSLNLIAVDGPTNESKGDGDAATWLPPNRTFRCQYVARQTAVKAKYGLWMTAAENQAVRRVWTGCPGEILPTEPGRLHPPSPVRIVTPHSPPTTAPPPHSAPPDGDCAPGYTPCLPIVADLDCGDISDSLKPIHVTGSDAYRLDADGDGLGCES
jgi:uncharacterized protein DUF1524